MQPAILRSLLLSPSRLTWPTKTAAATKQSQSAKGSATTASSTSWVLTSVLPSQFRDPDIIAPPAAPTPEEDSVYTALYTSIVSLISLSNNELPNDKFQPFLSRLHLADNAPLNEGRETSEKLLKRLEKEGYVVRVRQNNNADHEDDISWIVGPRGKIEVGSDGVRGLVRAVYAPADDAEEEDLERRVVRSLGLGERRREDNDSAQPQSNVASPKKRSRPRRNAATDDDDSDQASEEDDE